MIWILLAVAILVCAYVVWRVELARHYRKKPQPRHQRAPGLQFAHLDHPNTQPKEIRNEGINGNNSRS